MNLTIANDALFKIVGEAESFRLIKEAGFDGVDLQSIDKKDSDILLNSHVQAANETKRLIQESGLICNLAHAPFRKFFYGMAFNLSEPVFKELVNSIEYAAIVGAKYIVVHGVPVPLGGMSSQSLQYNYEFYTALAPYAKEFGIQIALENVSGRLPYPYQISEILRMLDDSCFTFLLDTGHARLCHIDPECFIRDLPYGTVKALHVQDMRGIEGKDDHILPGMGILNWDEILKALAENGYDGDFNMEVHGFLRCFDIENISAALKLAEGVGRSCIKRLEQFFTLS